jgi:hypothetical protein
VNSLILWKGKKRPELICNPQIIIVETIFRKLYQIVKENEEEIYPMHYEEIKEETLKKEKEKFIH